MSLPKFNRISEKEGKQRFQRVEGVVPKEILGMRMTPEFMAGLTAAGVEAGLYDDFETASQQVFLKLHEDSPMHRIAEAAKQSDREGNSWMAVHKAVVDIFNGQFENNWPEYL